MKLSWNICAQWVSPLGACALAFCAVACGSEAADSNTTDSADGGADTKSGDDAQNGDPQNGGAEADEASASISCKSVLTVPANEYVETEELPNVCQQTQLEHPLPAEFGSPDQSCDYLTGLSSTNLLDVSFGSDIEIVAGTCESKGCVKQCLKQFRSGTDGLTLVILDQGNFDVVTTLYAEEDVDKFEKWCTDLSPKGSVQDCE